MARLQKDIVSYFPHDSDACIGDTLTVLQSRFGNDGYAFWFKLLEKLASTDGHYVDCRNATKWHLLLAKTGVNEITGVDIMNLLVEMHAIDKDLWNMKIIWCQHLVNNVADVYKNRRRDLPQKPIITNHNLITTENKGINPPPTHNNTITTTLSTQSKLKESKLKESKLIYNLWNEQKIIIHKKLTLEIITAINTTLVNYSAKDISQAIRNYDEILKGEQYYFKYAWTLKDFLKRGLSKFLDLDIARKNYAKEGKNGAHRQIVGTDTKEYTRPDELRH